MSINAYVSSYLPKGYHTETAATPIEITVDGQDGKRLALVGIDYLAGATAHSVCIMNCGSSAGSRNSAPAGAAAAQADIVCTTVPATPSATAVDNHDNIAYQVTGGGWEWNTISSVSGSTLTLTNNIAIALLAGAKVRIFGVVADASYSSLGMAASVSTHFDDTILAIAPYKGDPLYIYDGNAAHAGFINTLLFAYINK